MEIKVEPLEGRWAEEASHLFDIDYLLEITNGQEEFMQRREQAENWLDLAKNLGLEEEKNRDKVVIDFADERVLLRNLQHFVSVTAPDERCPCVRGVVVDADHHFPGCQWIFSARAQEAETKKAREKVAAAEREMAEGVKRRQKEIEDANMVDDKWRRNLVVYMSTNLLQEIEEDVSRHLDERLKN